MSGSDKAGLGVWRCMGTGRGRSRCQRNCEGRIVIAREGIRKGSYYTIYILVKMIFSLVRYRCADITGEGFTLVRCRCRNIAGEGFTPVRCRCGIFM